MNLNKFPFYKQIDAKNCGPTCLKIIAKHYKKIISVQQLQQLSETTRQGSSLLGLSDAAEKIGFRSLGVKISLNTLLEAPLPCILHWNKNHYVVLYKIHKGFFYVSDPAHGLLKYNKTEFLHYWIGNNANENTEEGIALLLETSPAFYTTEFDEDNSSLNFSFLRKYLFKYKKFIYQLIIGLVAGSLIQLVFPFLKCSSWITMNMQVQKFPSCIRLFCRIPYGRVIINIQTVFSTFQFLFAQSTSHILPYLCLTNSTT